MSEIMENEEIEEMNEDLEKELGSEEVEKVNREELKEVEQEMIIRELEATENQLKELDRIEENNGNPFHGDLSFSPEDLAARGIFVKNVMEFTATLELSAPKDVSKMYNFSGLKSNLPRDDINLQFCRGQLKLKKDMLTDMMQQSKRKKSLLDSQTLLLLKTQEESHLVAEKTDFWRRAALLHLKENKPQLENNPEWLAEYRKDGMDLQQQTGEKFWKQVETGEIKPQRRKSVINLAPTPLVQPVSKAPVKGKREEMEERWQVSLSDDSWYRAPQFHPEGNQARRTDIGEYYYYYYYMFEFNSKRRATLVLPSHGNSLIGREGVEKVMSR
ncbi:uncharacterized protein LOC111696763 [Eurytemora carolleeae]|uniref:uncharacterized protein LOC111696763 n=1 Tax=Eurytemora carolleeae TaxID=1294199 RepID=UPI000C757E46|nr:uncharacterized protein LOC111696763 [Eurytemora carolleeae]|eukprot:XP_023322261.1 uncharacterized protein LOC111696763 [Eurytemora affinis]